MASGDFTASALPDVLVGMESVFTGDRHRQGVAKDVTPAQEILSRQLVDWRILEDRAGLNDARKCVGAKVTWLKDCDDSVDDCTDLVDCDLTGIEMESDSATYAPNLCAVKNKLVKGEACNDFFDAARKIGVAIANITLALDQDLQTRLESFILANGQVNRYTETYGTPGATNITNFTEAEWTAKIIAELIKTAEINDFYNYYGISGSLLYDEWFNGQFNTCCDSARNVFNSDALDLFWDIKNFDQLAGRRELGIVDPGAFGYFNANSYFNDVPQPFHRGSDLLVWRVPSSRLSYANGDQLVPVYYDIEMQEQCVVSGNLRYVDTAIRGVHRGGLHLAPPTCNAADTGILLFGVTEEEPAT